MRKKSAFTTPKLKGFTLMEILIVLVIIGILVLLALPNLMPLISKAKSTEAQLQLGHIHTLEKNYFYVHSKYSANINDIDFIQEKVVAEGGTANYKISIVSADEKGFVARATAVTDFNANGVFNVWEMDQDKNLKEVTKD